jgi:hypothetical protein
MHGTCIKINSMVREFSRSHEYLLIPLYEKLVFSVD